MPGPTLDEIAATMYAGPPAAFVRTRAELAKESGDARLAGQIRALRKPSVAAWVVNIFAAERAGELNEALRLAAELREAQEDLDAVALAQLGRERRTLTRRLADVAAELAAVRGERITPATLDAVHRTISAAFFDPEAAAAVASGRLVKALDVSGSSEDIRAAIAGGLPQAATPKGEPEDELRTRRERREAEKRVASAERALVSAERSRTKADAAVRALHLKATELAESEADLVARLRAVRGELQQIAGESSAAEQAQAIAAEQADAASEHVGQVRRELEAL